MNDPKYKILVENIINTLEKARKEAYFAINSILVRGYWEIGKYIVDYEMKNKAKAEYGRKLLLRLSKDLRCKYGKGFGKSNVYLMKQFYIKYPKFQTVSGKLSWSHYVELLGIQDDLERSFYEKQSIIDRWSIRELRRQIDTSLFYRITLNRNRHDVLEVSRKGQVINTAYDVVKDPYILEFLDFSFLP